MCGMCGLWGSVDHWSNPARLPGADVDAVNATRVRLRQAAAISRLTAAVGATVRDWGASSWIVENRSGGTEIVADLGAVWPAVERLTGRPVRLLSTDFLDALER